MFRNTHFTISLVACLGVLICVSFGNQGTRQKLLSCNRIGISFWDQRSLREDILGNIPGVHVYILTGYVYGLDTLYREKYRS